jgi:hypothetical protein
MFLTDPSVEWREQDTKLLIGCAFPFLGTSCDDDAKL